MIKNLHIENYAIIEKLDLYFSDGFNVFTGETGAGKSIIIGALSLLAGARSDTSIITTGQNKCIVEGSFSLNEKIKATLDDADIEYDDELIIRRTISSTNSSIRINERSVTLSFLQHLFDDIIDIHSQHDNQFLLKKSNHITLLDKFAEDEEELKAFQSAYDDYLKEVKEYENFNSNQPSDADLEFFRFSLKELKDANLKSGEEEELKKQEKVIQNAAKYLEAINSALNFYEDEGLDELLFKTYQAIDFNDDNLSSIHDKVGDIYYALQDEMHNLYSLRDQLDTDENNVDAIEERLYLISRLKRKYNRDEDGLIAYAEELNKTINSYDDIENYRKEKEKLIEDKYQRAITFASSLSIKRKEKALILEKAIKQEFNDLMLKNAQFYIDIKENSLNSLGQDDIEFKVSMNKGEAPKPLVKVASGGEISRLMLGLKSIFTALSNTNLMIFDEIDTGVSGQVALAKGLKMAKIASNCQVIAITHLSAVAACGDNQYLIYKEDNDLRTITKIKELNKEERLEQLALISSNSLSDSALDAAKELYELAQKSVEQL